MSWHSRSHTPAGEALRRPEALFHYRAAVDMLRSVTRRRYGTTWIRIQHRRFPCNRLRAARTKGGPPRGR